MISYTKFQKKKSQADYILAGYHIRKAVLALGLSQADAESEITRRKLAWRNEHWPDRAQKGRPRTRAAVPEVVRSRRAAMLGFSLPAPHRRLPLRCVACPKPKRIPLTAEERRRKEASYARERRKRLSGGKYVSRADRRATRVKGRINRRTAWLFQTTCWAFVRLIKFPVVLQSQETKRLRQKAYYEANREKIKAAGKKYRRRLTPEQNRERKLRWQAKNPEKHRAYRQKVERERRKDIRYRLNENVRRRIKEKMGRLGKSTDAILGYSMDELKLHLERQFPKGMGWHNRHLWHIDHIVPLRDFTYTSIDDPELKVAWALTNLRPVWAKANMSKGGKRTHLL